MTLSNVQTIQLTQANTSNSKNNQLRMNFPVSFEAKNCEIALCNAFIYYSWNNITSSYANNSCAYSWNGVSYPVNFPNGFYSIEDINLFIQFTMKNNGHYLVDDSGEDVYYISLENNYVYYCVTLNCTKVPSSLPTGWTNPGGITLSGNVPLLTIDNTEFGKLIGFTPATYPAVTQTTTYTVDSTLVPQISVTTSVNITCNMVNNGRLNILSPQSVYTFSPDVQFSSQIRVIPQNLLWYKIIDSQYSFIDIQLRDQNNNDLALIDTNMTMSFLIRTIKT